MENRGVGVYGIGGLVIKSWPLIRRSWVIGVAERGWVGRCALQYAHPTQQRSGQAGHGSEVFSRMFADCASKLQCFFCLSTCLWGCLILIFSPLARATTVGCRYALGTNLPANEKHALAWLFGILSGSWVEPLARERWSRQGLYRHSPIVWALGPLSETSSSSCARLLGRKG